MKSFHNTTSVSGSQLDLFETKAQSQEEILIEIFRRYYKLSASQAFKLYPDSNTPITSIRRGISNLTKQGKLSMTSDQVEGLYGRKEYVYVIV